MKTITVSEFDRLCDERGLTFHHDATTKGYISRKTPIDVLHVTEYCGRFGRGLKVYYPRYDTTRFISVSYFLSGS